MRQMKVDKLGIDLLTHDPVVILKDLEGKRYLPILIGPFEATAIALALEGTPVPRPLSHDLMRTLLEALHAKLEQIVIHDIKDSTFFAKLVVRTNGEIQEIDARPSDGIALALRMQAPIFVTDKIALEEIGARQEGRGRGHAEASRNSSKSSSPATSRNLGQPDRALLAHVTNSAEIGVFGGSGFYSLVEDPREVWVETPYGAPRDQVALGEIAGTPRRVSAAPRQAITASRRT